MKPVIKYQGGKSKELPLIKELLPKQFERVVEPFCGGAAVSFGLGYPALLSNINKSVINLYQVIADSDQYPTLQRRVDEIKGYDHDMLQKEYYKARDVINTGGDPYTSALSFIIMRQLCFSGMERYNANGEFNVPFGHYKKFACNLTYENSGQYWDMLRQSTILHGDFELALDRAEADDFVFIDPPYLERLGYHSGDGGDDVHSRLAEKLKNAPYKWMIVHSDHEFYREAYKDFHIMTKDFQY